jgi:hypothetical protein
MICMTEITFGGNLFIGGKSAELNPFRQSRKGSATIEGVGMVGFLEDIFPSEIWAIMPPRRRSG